MTTGHVHHWILAFSCCAGPKRAVLGISTRYQSSPSLHTSILKPPPPHTQQSTHPPPPVLSIPTHCISLAHGGGRTSIAHRRPNTRLLSHNNHEPESFCRARLWTSEWNEQRLFFFLTAPSCGEGRSVLAKTTSPTYYIPHYKPTPLFFVLKVENIMIELTIYIHTPYMLNTVNIISFLIFDFLVFFCYRSLYTYYSFETLFSANMDDFKRCRAKEQNEQSLKEEREIPRGCF